MATVFITSLSAGAGKTAFCAGLGKKLIENGKKIGYFKPVVGASDGDAAFMKEALSLPESVEAICPSFTDAAQLAAGINRAFTSIADGKDVVLAEGKSIEIARAISARAIIIASFTEIPVLPNAVMAFGTPVAGVVLNKVPSSQLKKARGEAVSSLGKAGINVLGVIPEDRALLTFTIAELTKLIDGQVLNSPEQGEALAENVMLGAMSPDSGLLYYGRKSNKVAIIRSERADMQMAALETSTRALVLTGKTPVVPQVQYRAEDRKVPIILTSLDTTAVATRLEDAALKTRFRQKSKLARLMTLLSEGIEFPSLYKSLGIA